MKAGTSKETVRAPEIRVAAANECYASQCRRMKFNGKARGIRSARHQQGRKSLLRELPPAFLDTPLSEEPAMVKLSMNEIERTAAAADGPVVSEGGCSPSTLSTGQRDASQGGTPLTAGRPGPLAPGRRWSAGRKREVVLRLLRGEAAELLSRELAVPIYKLEQWRAKAEVALDGALKEREGEPAHVELAAAMQRIGELSMENELLRSRIERPGPLARRRSR